MKREALLQGVVFALTRLLFIVSAAAGWRWGTVCLLIAALISGCAHRASVSVWEPAQVEVSDLKKLAVAGFSGTHGETIAAAVRAQLCDHDLSTYVNAEDSQAVRWVSATSDNHGLLSLADLQTARKAGIDGIVIGEVSEYRCEDHPAAEAAGLWRMLPHQDQPASQSGDGPREEPAATGAVRRDAKVAITFRLVDAQTGETRALRETAHSQSETLDVGDTDQRQHADVLDQLTRQCVDEFVRALVTHRSVENVKLARPAPFQEGYALIVSGNEFASRGRWDEAITAWEQAVARNPENDAALFNLSLAHLNRQNFRTAESYAIRALNLRHNEAYQAALQRIRQQASVLD